MLPHFLFRRNRNRTLWRKQKQNSRRAGAAYGANGLRLEPLEERRLLAVYTVTTNSDLDVGSSGSLRWAITQANANPGVDTIDFSEVAT